MSDTRNRLARNGRIEWVPIRLTRLNPVAQRDLDQAFVAKLAADPNLDAIGYPVVNRRDGSFYIMDGQHRIAFLKAIGYGDQQIQCEVYEGLSEKEEAEMYLALNHYRAAPVHQKFKVAVTAERQLETAIVAVVESVGLHVSTSKNPEAIAAVGALQRVFRRAGATTLRATLTILRDCWGSPAYKSQLIDGLALFCQRYEGRYDEAHLTERLKALPSGVNGVASMAQREKLRVGVETRQCYAAVLTDLYNSGRGGKKLPAWWKGDD